MDPADRRACQVLALPAVLRHLCSFGESQTAISPAGLTPARFQLNCPWIAAKGSRSFSVRWRQFQFVIYPSSPRAVRWRASCGSSLFALCSLLFALPRGFLLARISISVCLSTPCYSASTVLASVGFGLSHHGMSHSARHRPSSPGGKRILIEPMRASTGTVPLSSSYDSSAGLHSYTGYPADAGYGGVYHSRPNVIEPHLKAHPISSHVYRDPGQAVTTRREYAVRPRQRSSTIASATDGYLNPLRTAVHSSAARQSPVVVSSSYTAPPTLYSSRPPHTQESSGRYLSPSSSHRGRHRHRTYYTDYASDSGRLHQGRNPAKVRTVYARHPEHGSSHHRPHTRERRFGKDEDIDAYNAYSYTTPSEQFERESQDYVAMLNRRRGGDRNRRPVSMTGLEDYAQSLSLRERPGAHSSSGRAAPQDERDDRSRRPVQDSDDGHSPWREEHHHHRRRARHGDDVSGRPHRDDRAALTLTQYNGDPLVPGSGTGLATAVLASGYSDNDYDRFTRHPRGRSRDPGREYDRRESGTRDRPGEVLAPKDRRHHHRSYRSLSRRPLDWHDESDTESYSSDRERRSRRHRRPSRPRRTTDSEGRSGDENQSSRRLKVEDRRRRRSSRSRHRVDDGSSAKEERSSESPERPKKPIAVDPVPPKEPEAPPKGILKPPRDKFPEEPNPVREGVAPAKDAHKKGIPPGARWTKIDRKLVNPAALEAGKERFEERPDFVIVLRVLTKEEVQAYAVKTQEIRGEIFHFFAACKPFKEQSLTWK